MPIAAGDKFGSYRLVAPLGKGGREAIERINVLWQAWPEQNGYTKMRQSHAIRRYPW